MKRISIHTLGCKVNQVETEQIIEDFLKRGYQVKEFGDPVDVCIINTCTVTHISDRKSRAMLRRALRANQGALVVATGCMVQMNAEQISEMEGVGLVIGNQAKEQIGAIVDDYVTGQSLGRKVWMDPLQEGQVLKPSLYSRQHRRTRAFVKIQDGCQSFCSYCIVPWARGPVRSKRPEDIVAEIFQLLALGYKEIVLTGIHTGHYGLDLPDWDITRLLEHILTQVAGDYRIRMGSIEPLEITERILSLMASDHRLCRHLHIPLQSGSDRILASMGRRYSRQYYRQLVLKAAQIVPGAAFTADVMVGYPTETETDFQDTFDLIRELPVYELHVFKYSQREGTAAAEMSGQVAANVKQDRSQRLLSLGNTKRRQFFQSQIGQIMPILVEQKRSAGIYSGLSDNYMEVRFTCRDDLIGEYVDVRLDQVRSDFVVGIVPQTD